MSNQFRITGPGEYRTRRGTRAFVREAIPDDESPRYHWRGYLEEDGPDAYVSEWTSDGTFDVHFNIDIHGPNPLDLVGPWTGPESETKTDEGEAESLLVAKLAARCGVPEFFNGAVSFGVLGIVTGVPMAGNPGGDDAEEVEYARWLIHCEAVVRVQLAREILKAARQGGAR